jgi:hypothetical protein
MGRPRKTQEDVSGVANTAPALPDSPAPAVPGAVLAATYDPADLSKNLNKDMPIQVSPAAFQKGPVPFTEYYGEKKQTIEGRVGEPRPMFGSSLKEY